MIVTHAKVSGIANPADPDLVGGEDWDAEHAVAGPALVAVAYLRLTEGGGILSQSSSGFAAAFTKPSAGTYRANYDPGDWGSGSPTVVVTLSKDAGAPRGVRWSLENDGTDYLKIVTLDESGDAANYGNASLTVHVAAILP